MPLYFVIIHRILLTAHCMTGMMMGSRILVHRCVPLLSQLSISLSVVNCKKSESYYILANGCIVSNGPDTVVLGQLRALTWLTLRFLGQRVFSYHRDSPWPQKTGNLKIWESNLWFHNWWPAIHDIPWFSHYILKCKFWDYLQNVFFSRSSIALVTRKEI